jgi:hypothetical protein
MSVQGSAPQRRTGRLARRALRGVPALLAVALVPALACGASLAHSAIPPPEGSRPPARPAAGGRAAVEGGEQRVLQGRPVSMDEAVEMAQRRFNARVVRAEVVERDGRRVYVLRLLSDDGRVFNVRVDAATGSMQ